MVHFESKLVKAACKFGLAAGTWSPFKLNSVERCLNFVNLDNVSPYEKHFRAPELKHFADRELMLASIMAHPTWPCVPRLCICLSAYQSALLISLPICLTAFSLSILASPPREANGRLPPDFVKTSLSYQNHVKITLHGFCKNPPVYTFLNLCFKSKPSFSFFSFCLLIFSDLCKNNIGLRSFQNM